jgi:hypothetical protein
MNQHLTLFNKQNVKNLNWFPKICCWRKKGYFIISNLQMVITCVSENVERNIMCFTRFHDVLLLLLYQFFYSSNKRLNATKRNKKNVSIRTITREKNMTKVWIINKSKKRNKIRFKVLNKCTKVEVRCWIQFSPQ